MFELIALNKRELFAHQRGLLSARTVSQSQISIRTEWHRPVECWFTVLR